MSDIEIEIDGKKCQAKANAMVIQVADAEGIYIPRFCYHPHLSVAANCRMCLVEVEKSPKVLPACATPVMPGMKVLTRSPKALAAQRAVMEFLLINHPLDCPICDQGGECELQDLSMGYGDADSHYEEKKRSVKDQDIGPLIATEMTRCIQCTRCVRFGDEVAGLRELGAVNRGENLEISTYVERTIHSEISGNVIDLCPVGALTSKPFRFTARPWDLRQYPSIAAHDCVGSHINVHTHIRTQKVMRVVPKENDSVNQMWISDRDRYSYEGLNHADRLTKPRIRIRGKLEEVDWQTALTFAAEKLQAELIKSGADQLGAFIHPSVTVEECYLLQKLMRHLGCHNIDHRLRQVDFTDQEFMPIFPGLPDSITALEECDTVLLIGSYIQKEQPILSLRLRKAFLRGAKIMAVNMVDYPFHFEVAEKVITAPHLMTAALDDILKNNSHPIMQQLQAGKKVCLLLGAEAFNHHHASVIRSLSHKIANKIGAAIGFLTEGANAAGAWLAGAIPHRDAAGITKTCGLHAEAMLQQPRKSYILFNVEPEYDCANPAAMIHAFKQAEFILAFSIFHDPVIEEYADVILPIAPFTETSGTFINAAGTPQTFQGVTVPLGETRPAWKVLRVLGNLLRLEGFDYQSSEEVYREFKSLPLAQLPAYSYAVESHHPHKKQGLSRIVCVPSYRIDSIVRRASALQATQAIVEGDLAAVRMHSKTAEMLQFREGVWVTIKQNQHELRLIVMIDNRVPQDAVLIFAGVKETAELGGMFGEVEIMLSS